MPLKHMRNVLPPQDGAAKVVCIAWAPNNVKFAVATADRVILLFDESGEKKDKFSTKPADQKFGKKSYVVRGLAFSPDSTKIAVGQTDNIIYVYKIGEEWGDKKVICNKFIQSAAVTALIWPMEGPIVYGLADGKVRAGDIKTGKSQTLYGTNSFVCALAPSPNGRAFLSGHADGTVVRCYIAQDDNPLPQGKVLSHGVPPYALVWASNHIFIGGCDKKAAFFTFDGKLAQAFDYSRDPTEKELSVAVCSPSGQSVVVGSYNRVRQYNYTPSKSTWEEGPKKDLPNLYTITSLSWKRDGSRVLGGTLCGGVEMFDSVMKRSVLNNRWEMTFVGPSQVLIKPLQGKGRGVILKSQYGYEIEDVKIMGQDRYLMGRTTETLLLGDLQRNLLSEVIWTSTGGNEKFYFENENVCMIFNAGELSLVEYGNNEILGSVRTELMNPHLISVRINERKQRGVDENKKLAYLLDLKTIRVIDLVYGMTLAEISHDSKLDWLELNETGTKLLFRDKRLRLHLFDMDYQETVSLLNYCSYVSWVVGSDVVVAQNRENLCIWYNIDVPDRMTMYPVKGAVVDIERAEGKTEVIVKEGSHQVSYQLDEGLIEFGTAIEDSDFGRAVSFLESLDEETPEAEAMWRTLAKLALDSRNLAVAHRCYAALGDVARSRYLMQMNEVADAAAEQIGGDGTQFFGVRAMMSILDKDFKAAEGIYLEQGQVNAAMEMYQSLHRWDDALQLAEARGVDDLAELKESYMKWLMETGQEEKVGQIYENAGDYREAINMYLRASLPAKAARLALSSEDLVNDRELIQRIAGGLLKGEFYEKAGDLYERVNDEQKAMECYRRGKAFGRAVELARLAFPSEVVSLEEEWGDHLMSIKQLDAAINHYIEAGNTIKALDASVASRQWRRAVQIIQVIDDPSSLGKYYGKLAEHFASIGDLNSAEKFYLDAGLHKEAIEMYNNVGQWEQAHRLASKYLRSDEVAEMYINQAQSLEGQGKLRDAERLYIAVAEPDLAITMYKNHRQFDQMMRLVAQYHPDLVPSTHVHLAKELENEGTYQQAENHYVAAQEWKNAVTMYRNAELWEDAYRVAKNHGGPHAGKQVAFLWAKSLGGDSAVKLLNKFGLLEQCIEYACEVALFEFAFDLAKTAMKNKMPEIHYKHAMALEDDGKFQEAETEFIKAGKPKEAVLMYVHNQDWESAQRVAESHDADSVGDVLVGQAKVAFTARDYPRFESLLLRAQRPEIAIKLYRDGGMWTEALRLCKEYLPHRLQQLQDEYDREMMTKGGRDGNSLLSQARDWEETGDYQRAIDCYLKVTSSSVPDVNMLEKAWTSAGNLALKFLDQEKSLEVVRRAAGNLLQHSRYSAAAQLYLGADMIREAIDALMAGEEWGKAKKVAKELDPRYEQYVDSKYKDFLKNAGNTEQLASVDLISALDMYAERGDWRKCIDTAAQNGQQVLQKYLALYAAHLVRENQPVEAMRLYAKHGAPDNPQNYNLYKKIVVDMFSQPGMDDLASYRSWADLRNTLLGLTSQMQERGSPGEFDTLLLISHYYAVRAICKSVKSLEKIAARISVALLRHTDIIPADKAFYEAGAACKTMNWENMAFVFYNHFLDLCGAIDDGNADALDHSDFLDTDIPFEIPLPEHVSIPVDKQEEAKEWVLAVSIDQKVEQILPTDERMAYEASLKSPDGQSAPACIISGYPVLRNKITFRKDNKVANKEDWNRLIMESKMSPSSEMSDLLAFIGKWAGESAAPSYSFK